MMTKKYNWRIIPALLIGLLTISAGCKKESTDSVNSLTASISYTGIIAADGCGWLVTIDKVTYHPDNLPAEFQVNNLSVIISADITKEKFSCGNIANSPGLPVIHITSIVKKSF